LRQEKRKEDEGKRETRGKDFVMASHIKKGNGYCHPKTDEGTPEITGPRN